MKEKARTGSLVLPAAQRAAIRDRILSEVRKLPRAEAVEYGSHVSLEVRGRRFAWYLEDHHGDGRVALHCRAEIAETLELVRRDPVRFHVPKYVGHRGWVGYWLDCSKPKWRDVTAILTGAYCRSATKSLLDSMG